MLTRIRTALRRSLASFLGLDAERERINVNLRKLAGDIESLEALTTTQTEIIARLQDEQQRTLAAIDCLNTVDSDDVVEALMERFDASDIAAAIDARDVAYELDLSDVARELSLEDLASHVDVSEVADGIDAEYIAREVMKRVAEVISAQAYSR